MYNAFIMHFYIANKTPFIECIYIYMYIFEIETSSYNIYNSVQWP